MAGDGEGEVVVSESQMIWREMKECLQNEAFEKAVQLCNTGDERGGFTDGQSCSAFCTAWVREISPLLFLSLSLLVPGIKHRARRFLCLFLSIVRTRC